MENTDSEKEERNQQTHDIKPELNNDLMSMLNTPADKLAHGEMAFKNDHNPIDHSDIKDNSSAENDELFPDFTK